jgi:aarF domain-containing kinase
MPCSQMEVRFAHSDETLHYVFWIGIFIKMGQHMASLYVLPREWTSAMRPLQDQCEPTHYEDIEKLILQDMGASIPEIFDEFDRRPIGVASLAQVHVGRLKDSGRLVAVKVSMSSVAYRDWCTDD